MTPVSDYTLAEPRAASLVESLRAVGYDVPTAIADLIDNSISAGAENVWISFNWSGKDSTISILDDGRGMTEASLLEAMTLGSRSPLEWRDEQDLGRFGLGLKTASFSQCRRLTVRSRAAGARAATRCWDLDYIAQTREWRLLGAASAEAEKYLEDLNRRPQGTVVLWEKVDRVATGRPKDDAAGRDWFLRAAEDVERHLGMVFHRYLEGGRRLKIHMNGRRVAPWDPFLSREPATTPLPEEPFRDGQLVVRPYVLPHHSKIDAAAYEAAAGPGGWNARQGFYVYRNDRLLVAGSWLGLGIAKAEHHKLARIQIDLPNSLDAEWQIDVKKSQARPPSELRSDLKRIAKRTTEKASQVFRHRGKAAARAAAEGHVFAWHSKVRHGKTRYVVNREHPLARECLQWPPGQARIVEALLQVIEETVPVQQIWLDSARDSASQSLPFEGVADADVRAIVEEMHRVLIETGLSGNEVRRQLLTMEAFQGHLEVVRGVVENPLTEVHQ